MFVSLELGLGAGYAAIAGPPSPNRQVLLTGVTGIGIARAITLSISSGAPSLDFSQAANSQYLTMGFI